MIFWLQEHRIDPDGVLRRRLREAEKIDDLIDSSSTSKSGVD